MSSRISKNEIRSSVPSISKEVLALGHHIELESKSARKENYPEQLRILRRIQSLEKCGRLNDNGGKGCDCSKYIAKGSLITESFSIGLPISKTFFKITPLSTIHLKRRCSGD